MTNAPPEMAVRPRLDTSDWNLPRDAPGQEPEELSPLSSAQSATEYAWEQKDAPGLVADGQPAPIDIKVASRFSRPHSSMGSMSTEMMEEMRKMIKEEVAQLKNNAGSPADTLRFSPLSSQNPVFVPAYPSPPASVVDALSTSSPKERSPEVAYAKAPASVPTTAARFTPPISPQGRAVRFRSRGPPVIHCQPRVEEEEVVSPTANVTPEVELSSVDKTWGVLFDTEGFPTQRLNSVLRGLANFMISEFGAPESLVVTPEKMLVLYTKYKIEAERFRYEEIFKCRSKDSFERIEFLYQDLDCQYHLIQSKPGSRPIVPGLTPIGFAKWMVNNIVAYPDQEARRLHAIVSSLPIDVDGPLINGRAERLPKQLSRYLLPEHHDNKVRKILDEAVWDCVEEDDAPPLPAFPRPRANSMRLVEANTSRRSVDDRKRPGSVPRRATTYDRGSRRVEPHHPRLPRANSDAGASISSHRDLPPPPVGRNSVPQRQRSPPPMNRYSASMPTIPHAASSQFSGFSSDLRGGEGNYGVFSGRDRISDSREDSPRSPGFGRRGGRGPTWEELHSRSGTSGTRGGSGDAGSQRSFR